MDIKKTITLEFCTSMRIKCVAKADMPEYGIVAGQRFHLVRLHSNSQKYVVKAITVTGRKNYKNGDIRFEIVNNDGTPYVAYVRSAGDHSCNCKATKRCYHVTLL